MNTTPHNPMFLVFWEDASADCQHHNGFFDLPILPKIDNRNSKYYILVEEVELWEAKT